MPRPVKNQIPRWMYQIKGSPPAFLGLVFAANEKSAEKLAIKQFEIKDPQHIKQIYVRLA